MVSFPSLTSTAVIALIPPVAPSIHSVFSQLLNLSLRYVFTANPACENHDNELVYVFVRLWFGRSMGPVAAPYGMVPLSNIYAEVLGAAKILVRSSSMVIYRDWETDRKSTRLNSSHRSLSRMPSSA